MKASFTSIEEISFEYFLEFTVNDKVGVLESVSHLFSQHSISIKSMLQDNKKPSVVKSVHLIILTHLAKEKDELAILMQEKKESVKKPSILLDLEKSKILR